MGEPLTKAGAALLAKYIERERNTLNNARGHKLCTVQFREPFPGLWLQLAAGSGQELASAQKLVRDGYAVMVGGSLGNLNRFIQPTEAGRLPTPSSNEGAAQPQPDYESMIMVGG